MTPWIFFKNLNSFLLLHLKCIFFFIFIYFGYYFFVLIFFRLRAIAHIGQGLTSELQSWAVMVTVVSVTESKVISKVGH